MICSVFFHNIMINKAIKKLICIAVAALVSFSVCFCVYASSVTDKESASSLVDSVNLRQEKWVYSVYVDKNNSRYASVARYEGDDIDVEIPAELGGVAVKSIGREAFCGCRYITSVVIPDTVTDIGKYAFKGCIGLSSVSFPADLRSVGEGAFYGCRSLSGAVFPEGITKIESFAFYDCIHLKKAVFPSTLKSIGDSSFEGCSLLEKAEFGSSLDSIGDTAFKGCSGISEVILPEISELGAGAFINCGSLKNVVIGGNITELHPETFRNCAQLAKVSWGSSLEKLGISVFEGCVSLKSVSGAESLTEIGSLAFKGCSSLKTAEIGRKVDSIGSGAFIGCMSLTKISVSDDNEVFSEGNGCLYDKEGTRLIWCPQGKQGALRLSDATVRIDDYAAAGCSGITDILPDSSLKEIGKGAFWGCTDITAISLPDSVSEIDYAAFGFYFDDNSVKKNECLRIYAAEGSAAESYCSDMDISFSQYKATLVTGSERVVLAVGKSFDLTSGFVSRKRSDASWESSDESVVRVSNGRITAVSQGSADITVSADGFDSCVVKAVVVAPDDIGSSTKRTYEKRLIYCGETEELSSIFSQIIDPIFAANRFWYSSSPSVATVTNDGKVTALTRGMTVVTCRMPDGSENSVLVTVVEKPLMINIQPVERELLIGERLLLSAKISPSVSKDVVSWKSDNESIAKVDESGIITAVGQGKCNISAVTSSGVESSVEIKCVIPTKSVSLDIENRNVYQGKEFNLRAFVTPEESQQKIVWKSSDPSIASVNSKGKVVGKSFGTAVITAETAGGKYAECHVTVLTHAEELSIDTKKLQMNQGTEHRINAIIRPSYSEETTDKCTWNSTNEKVATVDENGVVRAVSAGKCIINCRTGGDLISKCQVQVRIPAESLEINAENDCIYIGEISSLKAVITPEDSTDTVEWFSDSEDIATVTSGGTIKGKTPGTATVTVKVTNGVTGNSITDTVEITVMKKAESVTLNKKSLSLNVGEKDFVVYSLLPDDCNDTVKWYSTDSEVATVRDDGLITAVSPGSCYIVAESGSGASARCKITVK